MATKNTILLKGDTQQVELLERKTVQPIKDADNNVTNAARVGNIYGVCLYQGKVFTVRSEKTINAIEDKRLHLIELAEDEYNGEPTWNFVTAITRDQHMMSLRDNAMEAKFSQADAFENYDFFAALDVKAVAKASS